MIDSLAFYGFFWASLISSLVQLRQIFGGKTRISGFFLLCYCAYESRSCFASVKVLAAYNLWRVSVSHYPNDYLREFNELFAQKRHLTSESRALQLQLIKCGLEDRICWDYFELFAWFLQCKCFFLTVICEIMEAALREVKRHCSRRIRGDGGLRWSWSSKCWLIGFGR
jgi:hypothetical protein